MDLHQYAKTILDKLEIEGTQKQIFAVVKILAEIESEIEDDLEDKVDGCEDCDNISSLKEVGLDAVTIARDFENQAHLGMSNSLLRKSFSIFDHAKTEGEAIAAAKAVLVVTDAIVAELSNMDLES